MRIVEIESGPDRSRRENQFFSVEICRLVTRRYYYVRRSDAL